MSPAARVGCALRGPGSSPSRWIALAAWQGQAYWEYSDGVYSLSARQLLDGRALYEDFAAAQPPPLYLLGAAALAISDTPGCDPRR